MHAHSLSLTVPLHPSQTLRLIQCHILFMHIYIYIYIYIYMCIYICVCSVIVYIYIYIYTQTCKHTRIQTHLNSHTHT